MKLKTYTFFNGKIEVKARTQTEARTKADNIAYLTMANRDAYRQPIILKYRGYIGVVTTTADEYGGSWSYIIDPKNNQRAFYSSSRTPRNEAVALRDHLKQMADDELGPQTNNPGEDVITVG